MPRRVRDTVSAPARADTAVDGVDHARRVAGTIGCKERHQVADLAGMRRAAERQTFLKFPVAALVAELVFGPRLQERHVTVGADRPWIDPDHADIVGKALAAER